MFIMKIKSTIAVTSNRLSVDKGLRAPSGLSSADASEREGSELDPVSAMIVSQSL